MPQIDHSGLRGRLCHNEPMADHTSWRTGGHAKLFYQPADIEDLSLFLSSLEGEEQILWVGLGSNLLVRDGGVSGVVICTSGVLNNINAIDDHSYRFEAGVSCAKAARVCARDGLIDTEFLAGIPGTIGGALAMNAGAFGGETWSIVKEVETIDARGNLRVRYPAEYEIGYRNVVAPAENEWFVAATINAQKGDAEAALSRIKELLSKRNQTQPIGEHSCGSVFCNPEGDYAARLIQASGLKGYCNGGACVSEKHANFIINTGNATASEIEQLIGHIADVVERDQGVRLITEVRIVGEYSGRDGVVSSGDTQSGSDQSGAINDQGQ